MSGYVQNTESNDAFIDGYFKTGDIGYVNEAGYVFLVGRSKELIKVKGYVVSRCVFGSLGTRLTLCSGNSRHQVAPADLESILLSHPKVCDAAVKGVYFPEQETEYPAAYITIDSAQTEPGQLQAEVEAFVNNQVAKYKWLRSGVHIIPAIPRK
jgi:4-coumarate--CoA ligase